MEISLAGIDQAVEGLDYRSDRSPKSRLVRAIMRFHRDSGAADAVHGIDNDTLIDLTWDLGGDADAIRSKRKNLSSIKSSVNKDLGEAWENGRNPEGITIGPENTFTMSDAAKDRILSSFSGSVNLGGGRSLEQVAEALKIVTEYLSDIPGDAEGGQLTNLKSLIQELSEKLRSGDGGDFELIEKIGGGIGEVVEEAPEQVEEIVEEDNIESIDEEALNETAENEELEETDFLEVEEGEVDALSEDDVIEVDEDAFEALRAAAAAGADEGEEEAFGEEGAEEDFEEIDADDLLEIEDEEDLEELDADDVLEVEDEAAEAVEEDDVWQDDGDADGYLEEDTDGVDGVDDAEELTDIDLLDEGDVAEETDAEDLLEAMDEEAAAGEGDEEESGDGADALEEVELDEDESDEVDALSEDDVLEEEVDDVEDDEDLEMIDDEDIIDAGEEMLDELGADEELAEVVDAEPDDLAEVVEDGAGETEGEADDETAAEGEGGDVGSQMDDVGLPVDVFSDGGIDLDEFAADEDRKKYLAERFDGYLGAMERFYNQYIIVPRGEYRVGATVEDPEVDALPARQITLPGYYMGKYPVTNALFEVFIERTGYATTAEKQGFGYVYFGRFQKIMDPKTGAFRSVWNSSHSRKKVEGANWYQPLGPGSTLHKKRNHPVVQVSLADAKTFAAWTGKRLPTEIEWEAAARTAAGFDFPWGDDWRGASCNLENSGISDTCPVDRFSQCRNDIDLSDLLGNVLEWTTDSCKPKYPMEKQARFFIAKSASWVSAEPAYLYGRNRFEDGFASNILGFRCVAD